MAKNFKDYMRSQPKSEQGNTADSKSNTSSTDPLNDKVNHYSRMSEQQLMAEMSKIANQEKNNGTLTPQALKSFYDSVAPMLNEQQRNRLKSLINTLK